MGRFTPADYVSSFRSSEGGCVGGDGGRLCLMSRWGRRVSRGKDACSVCSGRCMQDLHVSGTPFGESVQISWHAAPASPPSPTHTLVSSFTCHQLDASWMDRGSLCTAAQCICKISVSAHQKTTAKICHISLKNYHNS